MDTSSGKARLKHSVNTRLLNNLLGSVKSHNRVCEEEEMWQQYELAKKTKQKIRLTSSEKYSGQGSERRERSPQPNRPREYDIKRQRMKGAGADPMSSRETEFLAGRRRHRDHDNDTDDDDQRSDHREKKHSTFYTRKLHEAESNNPMRWGHDMYKKTHEEEFVSTDDERNRAESPASSRDYRRKSSRYSSESTSDDSDHEANRSKKHKKSHKRDSNVSKKSKKSSKDKKEKKKKDQKEKTDKKEKKSKSRSKSKS
eukprot:m.106660 g.106660  ORF g.106660 m.106660 type:complete len:256 (-) comp27743_c0_seq1:61-828(-)